MTENISTDQPAEEVVSNDENLAPAKHFTWKHKTFLILFGLFVVHLFMEIFLRVVGFVYFHESENIQGNHAEDEYVILCVGDSTTYGVGSSSPNSWSYPVQLKRMLKKQTPDQKFSVARVGFPGANSSQIAKRLEGYLQIHQPDLLILLIGNNDVWNLNETRAHLVADNYDFTKMLKLRIGIFFDSSRVWRFYKWTWVSFIDDERKENLRAMRGEFPGDKNFKKGAQLFGDLERVEDLYVMNYQQMLKNAEVAGCEVLVLDYHRKAKLLETEYLQPALKQLDMEMLDLGPYFDEAIEAGYDLIDPNPWHPNDLGYQIYCRIIFNELVERGIVKAEKFEKIIVPGLKAE